uniref:serine/threonine-protein kinase Nek2-like isoform X2 n=1 Tax=Styela clava TaxID=7725 RepID=UPI00193A5956|nr:serine/threonine-protein kinase Nek2-like isoform X2 [Styela clava]
MENYELVTNIGKGSSGYVFLAKSLKTKKLTAIKKIEIDENRRSRCKKSVVLEASILRRLVHPHIVECEEWFLDNEKKMMNIVLEYCDGGTMQDMVKQANIKNSYFPENKVLKWMAQIVSAVSYMHSKKILHRDLKTENVFIVKPDIAKLGDFGISKEFDHTLDLAQTCVGTPCYLSPELCQDIPYNSKSDVWALGCLLFEMAALKPAFDAANLVSLFYKIVKGDFTSLPKHSSQDMHELIALILQKDPENRPTASKLLQHKALSCYAEKILYSTKKINNRSVEQYPQVRKSDIDIEFIQSSTLITNADVERRMSPGPSYAYNMFLSGINSKPMLESKDNSTQFSDLVNRSNSVLGTNSKNKQNSTVPKIFDYEANQSGSPIPQEVETARPQTCPHSASKARHIKEELDFNDTVVTWSGYGDQGSHSRRKRCDSVSLSSGTDESSDIDTQVRESGKIGIRYCDDEEKSDSNISFDENSDYDDDDDFIQDEQVDDIPECIDDHDDELSGDSTHICDERKAAGDSHVLPGSAWLRTKRMRVLQQNKPGDLTNISERNQNNNNIKNFKKMKARLPGSSWLSLKQRSDHHMESSSDDAIVLGGNNESKVVVKRKESKCRHQKRSGKFRNLPGSAWLKKIDSGNRSENSDNTGISLPIEPTSYFQKQDHAITLKSCSSCSANNFSIPEKKLSSHDPGNDSDEYSYSDDFEDDFEFSDDDLQQTITKTEDSKSSLNIVQLGCIDILGEKVFNDLSSLFKKGLTFSEALNNLDTYKVDKEALQACYILLEKQS